MRGLGHPLLSARGLAVTLGGVQALDGLDLAVPAGVVYALLGGNGAGKTTTLNALLGFARPTAGEVHVDGLVPSREGPQVRRRLAYLPESVSLYPYLSGTENLRYFCAVAGLSIDAAAARRSLQEVGVPAAAMERRVAAYSKGMRQKVGLAIAYARQAKALLLDEPTSGLDPAAAQELVQRVRAAAAAGMAVLMVTHDLLNARHAADRIGILRRGRKVAEFSTDVLDASGLERMYMDASTAAA
jgi:ABC-2 type transport system ATP-binding protein